MLITSIKIKRFVDTNNKMIGVATIVLDNMIAIHDIKILESPRGLFLAMPSKKMKKGAFEFKDIVHPISKEARSAIETLLFTGIEYIDKHHLSSIITENRASDRGGILMQKFDDFVVIKHCDKNNILIKSIENIENESPKKISKYSVTDKNDALEESDDFIKWLEGCVRDD